MGTAESWDFPLFALRFCNFFSNGFPLRFLLQFFFKFSKILVQGWSGLAITVTEVITPPTKGALQPPAPPPPLSPPPAGPSGGGGDTPLGLIIGIVVGGLLLLCVLAAAIYKAKRVRVKALG